MPGNRNRILYYLIIFATIILATGLIINLSGCCLNLSSSDETSSVSETAASGDESNTQDESSDSAETTGQEVLEDMSGDIIAEFKDMVESGTEPIDLLIFIDENIDKANTEAATYMVGEAIRISEDKKIDFTDKFTEDNIQEKIYQALDENYEVDMNKLASAQDAELKALIDETIARKYKILSVEGFFMPLVDYSEYGIYHDYIDEELMDFINIYLDESNRPAVLDAGIVVSANKFLLRIDKAFKYLEKYPDSPRYDKVKQLNAGRLQIYLGGIDNTPVFDSANKIYPEKLAEFEAFAQQYEGTATGDAIKSYLELLDQENYFKTSNVDDFLQALYN
jgi:hypothetical protein